MKKHMKKHIIIGTGGLILISIVVIVAHLIVVGAVADAENGRSPFTAVPLNEGKNTGVLAPGQVRWYRFVRSGNDGVFQRQMDLTLIFTPDDGHRIHRVDFQLFTADQVTRWYWGDISRMQNMGAGGIVSRDGNPVTGERLWSGWVVDSDTYYVMVRNDADTTIDYWLFTGDIIGAELGEPVEPAPVIDVPAGTDPNYPLNLTHGLQIGRLAPGQEVWYSLVYDDYDHEAYEPHTFTFIFTPDDGQRVHHVGFEIFPLDQLHIWQRGDVDQLRNVGAGGVVSRDGDPVTGERLWSGWLMDKETYLLKVHNHTDAEIDFWLFEADILNAELGEASSPPSQVEVPLGTDPFNPMRLNFTRNTGKLSPGQERWYSFVRDDYDAQIYESLALTMFFTPDDGNRIHKIGFDLFPASQLNIWQRGDTDQLINLGAGGIVSRDGNPLTGELLWSGWLMDGETYYIRLHNRADVVIDYWLFTDDIVHPNLSEIPVP